MVVAACHLQLVVVRIDALTDPVRCREVHRCADNRENASVGQGLRIRPCELVGVDLCFVVEYAWRSRALEVEVGVVCEVADRICVADGTVGDRECIVVREAIGNLCREVAGVTALAVGADDGELHAAVHDFRRPEMVVQPLRASVDVVLLLGTRVQFELIGAPCDRDASARDAVCVPSDDSAHRGGVCDVVLAGLIAEHDVERFSPDESFELHKTRAVGGDGDGAAALVCQRIEFDSVTARHRAEQFLLQFCHCRFPPQQQ